MIELIVVIVIAALIFLGPQIKRLFTEAEIEGYADNIRKIRCSC